MSYRALAITPENAPVFLELLDLHIDFESINKAYLVDGFPPPMGYIFYTKEEFEANWKFVLGQELTGRFSLVLAKEGNPDV